MSIQTATVGSANPGPPRYRRSDYDVTNTVQVSSVSATRQAVENLYVNQWPEASFQAVDAAFEFIEQLFAGQIPGYLGIDTVYHDRQHTLDNVLAMATGNFLGILLAVIAAFLILRSYRRPQA